MKFTLCHQLLLKLVFILTSFSVFASNLPDLGQPSFASLSPLEERRLGQTILNELRNALELSDDVVVNSYLNEIGYRLVATLNQEEAYPYYFFGVKDNSINAFALPGGFVGVNMGLVLASTSESELAAVLAHEVSHISQHHIARMYERGGQVTIASVAGLIAAAIISTQNVEAGTGALAATLAGSAQSMINFTRENEKEADAMGMEALAKAGFDPQGMPSFFQRMGQSTRYYDNGSMPEFLRTHPLTESRLVAARERAASYPYRQVPDSQSYHLIKARIQAMSLSSAGQARTYFKKQLDNKTYANEASAQYGYALALLASGDEHKALQILTSLTEQYPNQSLFQLALSEAEYVIGKHSQSKQRLATALGNHPRSHALTLAYAERLLQTDDAKQAVVLLNHHALLFPKPETYRLLAQAYSATKQPQFAHMAQAEYHLSIGDIKTAVKQLEFASKLPNQDPKEAAQINARLTEVRRWLNNSK